MRGIYRLLCLGVCLGTALAAYGETRAESVKGGDSKELKFEKVFDSGYQVWVSSASKWAFEGSFSIDSGYNGWFRATDSTSLKVAQTPAMSFLFSATVFPATLSGKVVPTEEGDGPPPPTDWKVKGKVELGNPSINPAVALIAMGDQQTFTYQLDGKSSQAYWKNPEGWSTVLSETYDFPPLQAYAPERFTVQARLTSLSGKEYAASADAYYIGVEKISGGAPLITSTTATPGEAETIVVAKGSDPLSFSVTKDPASAPGWPENYPVWNPGNKKAESFTFTPNTAGEFLIEAICGIDKKAIKVVVVEVSMTNEHKQISATPPNGSPVLPSKTSSEITIKTNPGGYEKIVTLAITLGNGTVKKKDNSDSVWLYSSASEEKGTPRNPLMQAINISAVINDTPLSQMVFLTESAVFDFLYVSYGDNDYDKAWQYARWKYDVSTSNLKSISVILSQKELGLTTGTRKCTLSEGAFVNENVCASVLGHENVHGGQSWLDIITSVDNFNLLGGEHYTEMEAHMWEINYAHKTKIPKAYLDNCIKWYKYYARTGTHPEENE